MESMESLENAYMNKDVKEDVVIEVMNRLIEVFKMKGISEDIKPDSIESKFCDFIVDTLTKSTRRIDMKKVSLINDEDFENLVKMKLKESDKKKLEITFKNGNYYIGKYLADDNLFIISRGDEIRYTFHIDYSKVYDIQVIE